MALRILSGLFIFEDQVSVTIHSSRLDMKVKVLVAQSCLTLCNPMDCSPPGSSVHGILQARILERVAMPLSRDLFHPGIKPGSPALKADFLPSEPPGNSFQKATF